MRVAQSKNGGAAVQPQSEGHDRQSNSQTLDPTPSEGDQLVGDRRDIGTLYPAALGIPQAKYSTGLRTCHYVLREPTRHELCISQKCKDGRWRCDDRHFKAYFTASSIVLCEFGHLRSPEYCIRKTCWKRECQMRVRAVRP